MICVSMYLFVFCKAEVLLRLNTCDQLLMEMLTNWLINQDTETARKVTGKGKRKDHFQCTIQSFFYWADINFRKRSRRQPPGWCSTPAPCSRTAVRTHPAPCSHVSDFAHLLLCATLHSTEGFLQGIKNVAM